MPHSVPASVDLAWAAGFIDGEGCLSVNSGAARLTVSNTDRRPLDRLQALFGGSICVHGRGNPARGHRPSWVWAIHGWPSTCRVLSALRPFLVAKWEQADLILAATPDSRPSVQKALVEARHAA